MPDYDFSQLSPHDFEVLCRDLFQAEEGVTLESFKQGKDGGIDFRYARAGKNTIVQCKRFIETRFAGLIRELEKEAKKVHLLKPARYVLMAAVPLSDGNKDKIVNIIGEACLSKEDIFGRSDINNLLGKHEGIERSHYKLWLASTNVLEAVLHSDIVIQTGFQVAKIHGEMRRYVQGSAYPLARKALGDDHVVILSGQPGVGKTTLANMLLYEHVSQGFEPVVIREGFTEGKAMFRRDKRQVFYFDDFMGVTFLGDKGSVAQQREYRAIIEFTDMVARTKDKRLILTTREHLLLQAWGASEQIRHAGLLDNKVLIQMGDYSLRQRAEILYNHLFFSDLPEDYRDELLKDDFYLKIVKHDKFNPRLIEWLSSFRRVRSVPVARYQDFVQRLLQDPSDIWRHAYEQQISDAGRSLLLTMFGFGGKESDTLLQEGFAALHDVRARKYGFTRSPGDYGTARAELNGAFIRPTPRGDLEFINPAVQDWLNSVVKNETETAVDLVSGASQFVQVAQLWKFAGSELGGGTLAALSRQAEVFAPKLKTLAVAGKAKVSRGGSTHFVGLNLNQTLAVLIEIADALGADALIPVIEAVIAPIRCAQDQAHCDIIETIAAIAQFERASWVELKQFGPFFAECRKAVVASAEAGCSASELRALLNYYSGDDVASETEKPFLCAAFDAFIYDYLADELGDCDADADYDRLVSDLEYFGFVLGVDVEAHVSEVLEKQEEGRNFDEMRAEHDADEYRGRRPSRRVDDDEGIREMFGSLRSGV